MADLRDLGLSEYEARAYRSLLQTGPTTAKELSRVSDVPMGRIYDVLNAIEQYNLVRSQSASRPKKYVAVDPSTALERLLEDKKRELEEKVQQYEDIVDDLQGELEAAEPVEETFWTASVGSEETVDLLVERLAAADSRIVMVLSTYTEQFFDVDQVGTLILDELEQALERGVEVQLLMRPDLVPVLPESIGERYTSTLAEHENFAVRVSENVSGTFNLIDRTETVIEVPHPLKSQEAFALIDLKDHEFAQSVREEFEPRWESAERLTL
ncbi:TrmB family transcriptional regulator [Halorarius halobius]|uniref:TrmB family transcriptional regulator n=1 Tax=Halorarius halobius TaxID=2962671 RepID=UPI0020CD96CB|nr:helix-turn-helix domain-containing protein [Halorarius halobius]